MMDQDQALALLRVADETGARLTLVGDTMQLNAVGRGGVMQLAERYTGNVVAMRDGATVQGPRLRGLHHPSARTDARPRTPNGRGWPANCSIAAWSGIGTATGRP